VGRLRSFRVFVDPGPAENHAGSARNEQFARNFRREVLDSLAGSNGVYFRHMHFRDWPALATPRPLLAAVVRHPIERVVSWFYYQRWRDRPDEKLPSVCNSTFVWRHFCDEMHLARKRELMEAEAESEANFDLCVKSGECQFVQGEGGPQDWLDLGDEAGGKALKPIYPDYRSQISFFCGSTPDCLAFNSASACSRAKEIVEREFAVVGVLERLPDSLRAFSAFLPAFFEGISSVYEHQLRHNGSKARTNENRKTKKPLSDDVRRQLESAFDQELDFYHFCLQRLESQVRSLEGEEQRAEESSFDYEDLREFLHADLESEDYILL